MKHIFGILSPLTYYLAQRIAHVHHLDKKDCILLLTRDYQIPASEKTFFSCSIPTSYNVSSSQGRIFEAWKFWKTKQNIIRFDQQIDHAIGTDSFIWYTSVCSNDICSLMVTKPNCEGYYIMEDGLSSYRDFNPKTFTHFRNILYHGLLLPLWPRIFALKDRFIYTDSPKFRGCIATNDQCFPLHQNSLEVVGMPFPTISLEVVPDAVLSIEGTYEFISNEDMWSVYSQLAIYIQKQGYKHIACKFHPRFYSPANKVYLQCYEQMLHTLFGPDLIVLPPTYCLESVLQTYHADFYTGNSSIAVYASIMGCDCFSYISRLCDLSKYYKQFIPLMQRYTTLINI